MSHSNLQCPLVGSLKQIFALALCSVHRCQRWKNWEGEKEDKIRKICFYKVVSFWIFLIYLFIYLESTVGADKNETLVFVHFSAHGPGHILEKKKEI